MLRRTRVPAEDAHEAADSILELDVFAVAEWRYQPHTSDEVYHARHLALVEGATF
jgi:hypothetical protein